VTLAPGIASANLRVLTDVSPGNDALSAFFLGRRPRLALEGDGTVLNASDFAAAAWLLILRLIGTQANG
jgi:hypothetical protein